MTDTVVKKVRFLILEPEEVKIQGLEESAQTLRNRAWAEVTCTPDPEEACKKLSAREVDGLILLRPDHTDWKRIERVLLQWVSVRPEEVYVLMLAETPTYRDVSWSLEWNKNIWMHGGFSVLGQHFFSFGELVHSKVK